MPQRNLVLALRRKSEFQRAPETVVVERALAGRRLSQIERAAGAAAVELAEDLAVLVAIQSA